MFSRVAARLYVWVIVIENTQNSSQYDCYQDIIELKSFLKLISWLVLKLNLDCLDFLYQPLQEEIFFYLSNFLKLKGRVPLLSN
jgi:hypothetical protein